MSFKRSQSRQFLSSFFAALIIGKAVLLTRDREMRGTSNGDHLDEKSRLLSVCVSKESNQLSGNKYCMCVCEGESVPYPIQDPLYTPRYTGKPSDTDPPSCASNQTGVICGDRTILHCHQAQQPMTMLLTAGHSTLHRVTAI